MGEIPLPEHTTASERLKIAALGVEALWVLQMFL